MTAERVMDMARVLFLVGGAAAVVRGAALAWAPAGWIVAGALLVSVGLAGAIPRRGKE